MISVKSILTTETDLHDRAGKVFVDIDFCHDGRADVREVEVAGLIAEARPARRHLPDDGHNCRCRIVTAAEVEDVEANASVRREYRVLPWNDGHRERQEAPGGGRCWRKL